MTQNEDPRAPISFAFLSAPGVAEPAAAPGFLEASDGTRLAVRSYASSPAPAAPRVNLVLFHGGGAHSAAGYSRLARLLCARWAATAGLAAGALRVVTPDLRGHGVSGGPRGAAPSPDQVLDDADRVIRSISVSADSDPDRNALLVLAGHSSGAGLLANLLHRASSLPNFRRPDGLLFLAPQWGYRAGTDRPPDPSRPHFAKAFVPYFILNALTGGYFFGNAAGVSLNYPERVLKTEQGKLLVTSYSVNMANAVTPSAGTVAALAAVSGGRAWADWVASNGKAAVARAKIVMGRNDEVIDPSKVRGLVFGTSQPATDPKVGLLDMVEIEGTDHLGVLVDGRAVDDIVGWLQELAESSAGPAAGPE